MKTSSNKKPRHRHDRKVLVAEESTKNWADSDSESSSTSSSSSDSEQEEVHCLMANQTDDDETELSKLQAETEMLNDETSELKAEIEALNQLNSPKLSENGKAGIGFSKPESFKPNWLKNRLDKDKAKAGQKPFVSNQSWRNSKKVKLGWKKFQQRRDQHDQNHRIQFCKLSRSVRSDRRSELR
ncbi:hypothetical protein F511_43367 [Dorcoceras hygrometricum]|uniref:Uncharacterized protein n=1 Tax=Dorcoceras hygrometricum TaxID=472368 RepID=A0A2Z7B9C7_9LAMI|nr:hypothetical protein F511_43367 [Dorcoceras hygrometricum]